MPGVARPRVGQQIAELRALERVEAAGGARILPEDDRLDLIRTADTAGHLLTMPDALCATAARRMEAGLVAADLLTPGVA
ncbi:hypothetical protein [Streptomyces sp. NPDC059631]|uniref:hypothetical protein n=1 Tax=unclassified Streptomyces TaxID=2593676 RepID=UPI003676048D